MDVNQFLEVLNNRKLSPLKIEIAEWNSWTLVSCYSKTISKFISEFVAMGVDRDANVALLKALTEFLERQLSRESRDFAAYLTERSDGFAAFPVYSDILYSKRRARKNALAEAVERYAWANWWDDPSVSFKIEAVMGEDFRALVVEFKLKSLRLISVPTNKDFMLSILIAENEAGGFVTGGAAGLHSDKNETLSRAFGELLRHLIVYDKMKSSERLDLSFYERRLWGFANGEWSELVHKRLNSDSKRVLELPSLLIDQAISHIHADVISIHRCLFHNQPIFMGGALERLCI